MTETILVTGGAGFVGSNICIFLKRKYPHYTIYALDNLKRRGSELNINRLKEEGVVFIHGDIRNPEDFKQTGQVTCIIECSAEPSVLAGIDSPPQYLINTNLMGTINCLNHALKHNARFIFLSTSRVYPFKVLNNLNIQETEERFELDEQQNMQGASSSGIDESFDLTGAKSLYGASKLASELIIQEYNEFYNIKAVINRCGVIAGPWQMGKVDQGFVTLWLARHFWNQKLSYIGFNGLGKQVRDILHIDDLQELIDWQLAHISAINGEIFNVGGGHKNAVSLKEMTAYAQKLTGNKIPVTAEPKNRKADIPVYISDTTKIKNQTGWEARRSVKEINQDVCNWLHKHNEELRPVLA